MNLYEIETSSSQRHFIVSDSYAMAEKIWKTEYASTPSNIKFVTPCVQVQKEIVTNMKEE